MESLLNKLEEFKNWKDILRVSCKNNGISTSLTGQLTILKARSLNKRFQKTYEKQQEKFKYYWGENQLKSFHWILICASAVHNMKIQEFSQNEWQLLENIFKSKEKSVLEYQAAKLLNSKIKKSKSWSQEEQKLLLQIIEQEGQDIRWNEIGRSLHKNSKKVFFRTGKQCRQRWLNHLDPKKRHGGWSKEEDMKLLQLADSQSRKWAKIVKNFDCQRTQHMIKNRFKSLLVKQKKDTPHLRKQQKLIEALKERLKNSPVQKIGQQDSFDSEVSSEQNGDKIKFQQKPDYRQVVGNNQQQFQRPQSEDYKINQINNNTIWDQKQHQQKILQFMDPNISNYFEEVSDNRTQQFGGFKIFSPYCLAYSMGSNLTPTGLTPKYFSPPAIFMNSFTQNMLSFQKHLSNFQAHDVNVKNQ